MADVFIGNTQIQDPVHDGSVIETGLTKAELATQASTVEARGGKLFIKSGDDHFVVTEYRTAKRGHGDIAASVTISATKEVPGDKDIVVSGEQERARSIP